MQAFEDLVDEVADVVFGEVLTGVDDAVQVGLHEFGEDVVVVVATAGFGELEVEDADDVLVFEVF